MLSTPIHSAYYTLIILKNIEKTMKTDRLIKMANDISDFFNAEPDKEVASEGVKNHIMRAWEPRMREAIIAYCHQGGEGLSELAKQAITKLPA